MSQTKGRFKYVLGKVQVSYEGNKKICDFLRNPELY